jgi:hypothetical protein
MQSAQNQLANQFLANFIGGQQFEPNLAGDQQLAFDYDVMGGPIRNMERRARNYRFSEEGNVGSNTERAMRELEAAKLMAPGWFGPEYLLRP